MYEHIQLDPRLIVHPSSFYGYEVTRATTLKPSEESKVSDTRGSAARPSGNEASSPVSYIRHLYGKVYIVPLSLLPGNMEERLKTVKHQGASKVSAYRNRNSAWVLVVPQSHRKVKDMIRRYSNHKFFQGRTLPLEIQETLYHLFTTVGVILISRQRIGRVTWEEAADDISHEKRHIAFEELRRNNRAAHHRILKLFEYVFVKSVRKQGAGLALKRQSRELRAIIAIPILGFSILETPD